MISLATTRETATWLIGFSLVAAVITFCVGNLLLLDLNAFLQSAQLTVAGIALLLAMYLLWYWSGSFPLALVLLFVFINICIRLNAPAFLYLLYPVGIFGFILLMKELRLTRSQKFSLLLIGLMAALVKLGFWSYASFDIMALTKVGLVAKDTLFHASIASMLKSYGVASTGLNGVVETPYHVLSHTLFAATSYISNAPVLSAYGTIPTVFVFPLLLVAITVATPGDISFNRITITLVTAVFLLLVLPKVFGTWAVWGRYHFSESYQFSLIFLLASLPLLGKIENTWFERCLIFALAILAAEAKSSVGLFICGIFLTKVLFFSREKFLLQDLLFFGALIVTFYFVSIARVNASTHAISLSWLHFPEKYGNMSPALTALRESSSGLSFFVSAIQSAVAFVLFIICHFFLSWLIIGKTIWQHGILGATKQVLPVYVMATMIAGAVIAVSLDVLDNAHTYFSNVAMFVALPAICAWCANLLVVKSSRTLILAYCFFLILISSIVPSGLQAVSFLKRELQFAGRNVQNQLVTELISIREHDKKNSFYQFAQNGALQALNPMPDCTVQPFLMPAVSERAWLGILSEDSCDYKLFGYQYYDINFRTRGQNPKTFTKSNVPDGATIITIK